MSEDIIRAVCKNFSLKEKFIRLPDKWLKELAQKWINFTGEILEQECNIRKITNNNELNDFFWQYCKECNKEVSELFSYNDRESSKYAVRNIYFSKIGKLAIYKWNYDFIVNEVEVPEPVLGFLISYLLERNPKIGSYIALFDLANSNIEGKRLGVSYFSYSPIFKEYEKKFGRDELFSIADNLISGIEKKLNLGFSCKEHPNNKLVKALFLDEKKRKNCIFDLL